MAVGVNRSYTPQSFVGAQKLYKTTTTAYRAIVLFCYLLVEISNT